MIGIVFLSQLLEMFLVENSGVSLVQDSEEKMLKMSIKPYLRFGIILRLLVCSRHGPEVCDRETKLDAIKIAPPHILIARPAVQAAIS